MSDFLARRMLAKQRRDRPRCWGLSSDALALYGLEMGPRPVVPGHTTEYGHASWRGDECGRLFPHDPSDLLACELTYEMAGLPAQLRMEPVLVEFRAWVLDGVNRYGDKVPRMGYRGKVEPGDVPVPEAWGDCVAPLPESNK